MIHESSPWKRELGRDAAIIERWASRPETSERRSFLIERKVFLAAYALRKLDEAAKLSKSVLTSALSVARYPSSAKGFSPRNTHHFCRHFDLTARQNVELPARRLVNLLIHSLVFVEVIADDHSLAAFMVTSDHEQARGLYEIRFADFVGLLRAASADNLATLYWNRQAQLPSA